MFVRVGLFTSHLLLYQMTSDAACAVFSIAVLPLCFPYAPSIADWTTAGIEAAPYHDQLLVMRRAKRAARAFFSWFSKGKKLFISDRIKG